MRLFLATTFEDEVLDGIVRLQDGLREVGVDGRFSVRENLHMTLAFIGEYGDPNRVMDVVEEVPFTPIVINPEGLSLFRDMYLLRFAKSPRLEAYVRRLRRALAEADVPFDRKLIKKEVEFTLVILCDELC